MGYFDGLNDDGILEMARQDFVSAMEGRRDVEERKLRDYRLYRRFNEFVSGGALREGDRGEHGFSKQTMPLVFWITETVLPRIGVDPPKVTVSARSPEAGPFAQAAQLRMDRHMRYCWFQDRAIRAIKQFLVLGDAPIKTPWDFALNGPSIQPIPWFDWFISSEAIIWDEAEVLFHRTWHTKRSLQELARRDRERDERVYDAGVLEELADMASNRDSQDTTWSPRREAAGITSEPWFSQSDQVALVECWYRDGSRVLIGGMGEDPFKLVRVVEEPSFVDMRNVPFRPFTVLQNTPDLFTPYGISDAEMLEDHQSEASTMRRQAVDQATLNINAPIAFDATRVDAETIQEGFRGPNGLIPMERGGTPSEAIQRFPPGQLSGDHDRIYELVRSEAQMIAGVSDISAGQTQYGADNTTATGMSIIASEANMRFRMKLKLVAIGFQRLACNWHNLDRLMGSPVLGLPVASGFTPEQGQLGIQMDRPGFVSVTSAAYGSAAEYDIEVDAGAMAPPGQAEQVQKVRSLAMDLGGNPALAGMTNWQAVGEMLVEAAGYDPQRVLMAPMQPGLVDPGSVPPGPGPPPPGPSPELFPGAQQGRMPEPVA